MRNTLSRLACNASAAPAPVQPLVRLPHLRRRLVRPKDLFAEVPLVPFGKRLKRPKHLVAVHPCLKLDDDLLYDDEFEDENLNICSDCNEVLVAALPDDYFAKLATLATNAVTRNSSQDSYGPAYQMSLFDAPIMANDELSDVKPIEISDSTQ